MECLFGHSQRFMNHRHYIRSSFVALGGIHCFLDYVVQQLDGFDTCTCL